jgi:hypothetical protein
LYAVRRRVELANPRCSSITEICCAAGGYEIIAGVFRDYGPHGGMAARPDIPFKIFLPEEFGVWNALNSKVYSELKRGSRFILLDE